MGKKRSNKQRSVIAFYEKYKRWPVITDKDLKERRLAEWIVRCRYAKNHFPERVPAKLIELIDRIDADKNQKNIEQWENSFNKLKNFLNSEKHWPSPSSSNPEEVRLHNWCSTQQELKKKISLTNLDVKRISMLDSIGFSWAKFGKRRSWDESFKLVKNFYNNTGRWPSHTYDPDETKLAKWCSKMRAYRNGSDSSVKLTSQQIQRLTRLGFDWSNNLMQKKRSEEKMNRIWINRYTEFCEFLTKEKRYPRSKSENRKEEQLFTWWMRVAYLKRIGKLSKDRIQMLDRIGFKWGKSRYSEAE